MHKSKRLSENIPAMVFSSCGWVTEVRYWSEILVLVPAQTQLVLSVKIYTIMQHCTVSVVADMSKLYQN